MSDVVLNCPRKGHIGGGDMKRAWSKWDSRLDTVDIVLLALLRVLGVIFEILRN